MLRGARWDSESPSAVTLWKLENLLLLKIYQWVSVNQAQWKDLSLHLTLERKAIYQTYALIFFLKKTKPQPFAQINQQISELLRLWGEETMLNSHGVTICVHKLHLGTYNSWYYLEDESFTTIECERVFLSMTSPFTCLCPEEKGHSESKLHLLVG